MDAQTATTTTTTTPANEAPTNGYTIAEQDAIIGEVAGLLANSNKAGDAAAKSKTQSAEMQSRAKQQIFPLFDTFGLDKDAKISEWKKNPDFFHTYNDLGKALSKRLKDKVTESKQGNPVFSGRVKKQLSRLTTAYRTGNIDGTQSDADLAAKEAAKERSAANKIKAKLFDEIFEVYGQEDHDEDALEVVMDRALAQFPNFVAS